jgi:FkbM family methyltransferase
MIRFNTGKDENNQPIKSTLFFKIFLLSENVYGIYRYLMRKLTRFLNPRPLKIDRYGKTYYLVRNLEHVYVWHKNWERKTHKIFDRFLDPKYAYIDIGAFIGATVLYGAQTAKKVYAVEPDPLAFKELEKNVLLNPGLKEKIELHNKCINVFSGKVRFGNCSTGGDSMSSLQFSAARTSWIVDGITFEDFIKENNIVDVNFIKMDIEGGEALVLPTMKNYLKTHKPVLYLSVHQPFFKDPRKDTQDIIDVLEVYANVYSSDGKRIDLLDLMPKNRLGAFFEIVATDKTWEQ